MVFYTSSVQKAIFYSFFPFWLLDVGRAFLFVAVPAQAITSPLYPQGRIISFTFSPFFIISITTIVILYTTILAELFRWIRSHFSPIKNNINNTRPIKYCFLKVFENSYLIFFLMTFVLFFLSSSLAHYFTDLSILYTTIEYSYLAWLILILIYFRSSSKSVIKKMLATFFFILFSMLVLEAGVTYIQFIKRGVVGLGVEKVSTIPSFGLGADENPLFFRPVGLNFHANALANWQITLLTSLILLWIVIKDMLPKKVIIPIILTSVGLSLSIIVLTISRSAYLSLVIFSGVFLAFDYKSAIHAFKFTLSYVKRFKIPILVVGLFFLYIICNRTFYTIFSLSETGGLSTRSNQIKDAIQMIGYSPFIGVGTGMFISAEYDFNPQGTIISFPENVHNGFILFLAERGYLAMVTYLVGLFFLIKRIKKTILSNTTRAIIAAGICANFAMMIFQPFINTFFLNILITCILVETKIYA